MTIYLISGCFLYAVQVVEIPKQLKGKLAHNAVKEIRERLSMSKAELARKAGVSPLTIDRIEKGENCRMETKRKIILALGYDLSDSGKLGDVHKQLNYSIYI